MAGHIIIEGDPPGSPSYYMLYTGKLQPAVFLCFYFCKYFPDAQGGFLQLTFGAIRAIFSPSLIFKPICSNRY